MSFVQRNAEGCIVALFADAGPGHSEELPADHPEVAAFLGGRVAADGAVTFTALDADLIRVIEDVVDVLIDRGLLRLTDLPPDAQRKLLARKGARERLRNGLNLLGKHDVI